MANSLSDKIRRLEDAFRATFLGDDGELTPQARIILGHLEDVGFATKSTQGVDALETARNNGRRDMWLEIAKLLHEDWSTFYERREREARLEQLQSDGY